MDLKSAIQARAEALLPQLIEIRRHLHANPELSFEEYKTSAYVQEVLRQHRIPFEAGMVKTGVVGIIQGRNPDSRIMALRADMDALPITEANSVSYASQTPGVMHACGHDAHTASLLGAAIILNELKAHWDGTVKLIFQPGEEVLPGGASLMIQEGVLQHPAPESILGQHVFPSLEAGKVGFRKGMYMASTDELYVTVKGKGGHAAMPQDYNNPIFIASEILLQLQQDFMVNKSVIPRKDDGTPIPTVLAFGRFIADGVTNVVPDSVSIEGTFRTMDEAWRKQAHAYMVAKAHEIASQRGGSVEFKVMHGYPFLVNDEALTARMESAAKEYLGHEQVVELDLRMTAEDFAFYSQQLPACFYRLGTANAGKGITSGVHTATFDIDEQALKVGAGLMAWLTVNNLT